MNKTCICHGCNLWYQVLVLVHDIKSPQNHFTATSAGTTNGNDPESNLTLLPLVCGWVNPFLSRAHAAPVHHCVTQNIRVQLCSRARQQGESRQRELVTHTHIRGLVSLQFSLQPVTLSADSPQFTWLCILNKIRPFPSSSNRLHIWFLKIKHIWKGAIRTSHQHLCSFKSTQKSNQTLLGNGGSRIADEMSLQHIQEEAKCTYFLLLPCFKLIKLNDTSLFSRKEDTTDFRMQHGAQITKFGFCGF